MANLTVGKLAKAGGVGVETVRFYERNGLMPEPERLPSGYRIYNENSLVLLKFVQRAKHMGFTLGEIKELLELSNSPKADCGDTCAKADEKIADIELRIADMQHMKKALGDLRRDCPGGGSPISDCSILKYFYGENK